MNALGDDPTDPVRRCCYNCEQSDLEESGLSPLERTIRRVFIVCDQCGNKRCPKATDHNLNCTGSNATGQKGSRYE